MSEDQCSELSGEHQQMQTGQLLVVSLNLQPYIILLSIGTSTGIQGNYEVCGGVKLTLGT